MGASEHEKGFYGLAMGAIPGGSRGVRGVPMRPVMSPASSAHVIFDASRTVPDRPRKTTSKRVVTRPGRFPCS